MVLLTMTPAMVSASEYLLSCGFFRANVEPGTEHSKAPPVVGNPISHEEVIQLAKNLTEAKEITRGHDNKNVLRHSLDHLLRGSRVYIEPSKPKTEPTSEYKALMARLRREEEAREYDRMTSPPPPSETLSQRFPGSRHAHLFPAYQADVGEDDEVSYADVNRQMTLIINIIVSIVACSVVIWMAARHWSTPSRLGLSMGGSSMVGVAEVIVYAGYLRRVREAKEKGKKAVEIKEIVKTWVIGADDQNVLDEDAIPIQSKPSYESEIRRRRQADR